MEAEGPTIFACPEIRQGAGNPAKFHHGGQVRPPASARLWPQADLRTPATRPDASSTARVRASCRRPLPLREWRAGRENGSHDGAEGKTKDRAQNRAFGCIGIWGIEVAHHLRCAHDRSADQHPVEGVTLADAGVSHAENVGRRDRLRYKLLSLRNPQTGGQTAHNVFSF